MYYATFKGIKNGDIVEFKTKIERDNWVNFKDPFSVSIGSTPEDCTYERDILNNIKIIKKVINNKNIPVVYDECVPGAKWYLRSTIR
jgi:hypothetical protein